MSSQGDHHSRVAKDGGASEGMLKMDVLLKECHSLLCVVGGARSRGRAQDGALSKRRSLHQGGGHCLLGWLCLDTCVLAIGGLIIEHPSRWVKGLQSVEAPPS